MRKNILHKVGAFILATGMLGGVAALAGSTAQAQRRRVIIAPQVYVGHRRPYYRHWRHHGHHYRW